MGVCGSAEEVIGSKSAEYSLIIQYCKGWGYRKKADYVIENVAKDFGDKVIIIMKKDKQVTGNFEVSITEVKTGNSKQIHSKKNGQGFIKEDNYEEFSQKIKEFVS